MGQLQRCYFHLPVPGDWLWARNWINRMKTSKYYKLWLLQIELQLAEAFSFFQVFFIDPISPDEQKSNEKITALFNLSNFDREHLFYCFKQTVSFSKCFFRKLDCIFCCSWLKIEFTFYGWKQITNTKKLHEQTKHS